MSGNIKELLDYLELYKVLLEANFYDGSQNEDAEELLSLINRLQDGTNIKDFDFNQLKRKVSKIFHPDIYKSFNTEKLGINNLELLSKVNNAIDEIIIERKNPHVFKYDDEQVSDEVFKEDVDYTKNDYFGRDEKFPPKPKSEKELREERIKESIQNAKNEIIRTKDYVCTVAIDRFNATFRNIPSNVNDYIRIKKRYEDMLLNYTYRDKVITSSLTILYEIQKELERSFDKETTDNALTYYYHNLISNKKRRLQNLSIEFENSKQSYYQVFGKYEPEYHQLIGRWVKDVSELKADVYNINSEIQEELNKNTDSKSIKGLLKIRERLEKEQKKSPKYEDAKEEVKRIMLEEHPDLREVYQRYNDLKYELNSSNAEYSYIINNSRQVKINRLNEIKDDYTKRNDHIAKKIKMLEYEHESKKSKIFKTRRNYNDFLDKYQYKYENTAEYVDSQDIINIR